MSESTRDRQLLHDCVTALERLLACPDLNLDSVEQTTRYALAYSNCVLEEIKARLQAVYCVLCGELLPDVLFTGQDRGQLVAFTHRACAEKARKPATPTEQS